MSYFPSLQKLKALDLDGAKQEAKKDLEPSRSLAVAFVAAPVLVTFDNPEHPHARWGKVFWIHCYDQIRVSHVGTGDPFEVRVILPED